MKHTQYEVAAAAALPASEDPAKLEVSNRAKIIRSLIKTRAMLQETRNRSAELQCALELFKYKKAKLDGG